MVSPWRLCTAPMLDWSDRHCRVYFRALAPHARLYTEMITTAALLHGDVPKHLDFDAVEHPVALQLGGSEPEDLAHCTKLAKDWGYDEVNLNCGCPSERVQKGSFGACLMREPALVADCVKAMVDAADLPITVKHRIGIDAIEDYDFVRDFVGTVADAGAQVFIVHARNAILKGLSPKQNREVPPLKYDYVAKLKADFPALTIVLNGGLNTPTQCLEAVDFCDGVMLGRAAYHDSWQLALAHAALFPEADTPLSQQQVAEAMHQYAKAWVAKGGHMRALSRHLLGLYQGVNGARAWRRWLSDPAAIAENDPDLILKAIPRSNLIASDY